MIDAEGTNVEVFECPNGPLLVRGADRVFDHEGRGHAVTRPVVAVCRCDKSQRLPWCDGTHKVIAKAAPVRAVRRRGATTDRDDELS